jgi:hypothetical protein
LLQVQLEHGDGAQAEREAEMRQRERPPTKGVLFMNSSESDTKLPFHTTFSDPREQSTLCSLEYIL